MQLSEKPTLVTQVDTGCRITCQIVSHQELNFQENSDESSKCLENKEVNDQGNFLFVRKITMIASETEIFDLKIFDTLFFTSKTHTTSQKKEIQFGAFEIEKEKEGKHRKEKMKCDNRF